MPTNTLTRHVPPAEVNCGFTYIGVLFNFLTLKNGENFLLKEIFGNTMELILTHNYIFIKSDF